MPLESSEKFPLGNLVKKFKGKKILVWGDLVLDRYIFGDVWRISREAPVLILKYTGEEFRLGGAGNAVNNLVKLGAKVYVWGWLGRDREGERIKGLLEDLGVDTRGIWEADRVTIEKTRLMAGGHHRPKQQVIRVDKGEGIEGEEFPEERFLSLWEEIKEEVEAVLVSDYGYGSVDKNFYLKMVRECGKKIFVVDSRFSLSSFPQATVITPNEEEAKMVVGEGSPEEMGKRLLQKLSPQAVILTRGKDGMVVMEKGKPAKYIPIYGSDEVTDVTGAGDTVASVVTLSLASGATFYQAAQIANYAAGMVVMKMGVATVSEEELLSAIGGEE